MPADLATLAIVVDSDKATADVLKFGQASLASAEKTGILEQSVEKLEGAMAKIRTAFGLGLFGFEFIKETIAAQDAMAQLEAGVRSTGEAAGFTAEQLEQQANALQKVTAYSHNTIEQAQGVLLMFTRIDGVNFTRATEAAANLATRIGGDVPEAARTLGRALEDPANGLMMLRRAGIVFSEGQKEMLTNMVQAGHGAEAQTRILELLEQRLGGSAEAARETLGGSLKGLAHDFADLFEVTQRGSSPLIDMINAVDSGVNMLKDHMGALTVAAGAMASVWAGRVAASMAAYVARQAEMIRNTIIAAKAEVEETAAATALAVRTQEAAAFELELATTTLANAKAHEQCAFGAEEEATALSALTAAEVRLEEATAADTAATIALTEAQIAEGVAATAAAAETTVLGIVMAGVRTVASTMWKAIGGPIGAIIIGLTLVYEAYEKIKQAIEDAHTAQTAPLNNDPQLEKAITAQNAAAAAAQRAIDDQNDALLAARKADAERDSQTAKLNALNAVYMKSALALKIYGIELDANTEKVKAHKGVVQAEWATIDASIDASTRAQVQAAKLDFGKNATENLTALHASNDAMIQAAENAGTLADAQAAVGIAQMISTRAGIDAQTAYEHLNIALEENAKIEAARVQYQKAVVGATQDEIDAAKTYLDEQIRGIEAEHRIRDATVDRIRAIDDLKSAMQGIGDIMDMVSGKSQASIEKIIDAVKNLSDTIQAMTKNGSLQDAISVLMGGQSSGGSAQDIFKLPTPGQANIGKMAAGAGQAVGMIGAGFSIGQMIGGMTTNKPLGVIGGTLGGGVAGAAMGATMGGPLGAIAGGIIGAGAGLIGSFVGLGHSAAAAAKAEHERMMAEQQITTSLADWRAQITGTAADQAAANAADLRWKYLQLVQTIESVEAGKKMEDQRNKDLKDAADLYAMAQKKLTDTTNTLNDAFTGMINAVSGYRLNLQLFNYSPAFGPGGTPTNPSGTGSGSTAGSGGGSGGGGGGGELTPTPTFIVQLAVDGKVLAQSTVRYARKIAQSNLGSSDKIVDALQLIG